MEALLGGQELEGSSVGNGGQKQQQQEAGREPRMASIAEDRRAAGEEINAGGVLSAPGNDGDSQLMFIAPASLCTRYLFQAPTEPPENRPTGDDCPVLR